MGGLFILLGACSGGASSGDHAPAPIDVGTVMPKRQAFHTTVAAFGELAADNRNALSISLPQPAEILATDVLPGRRVSRGTVLLKYASDPTTRSAYLQAQNALQVARDDLTRTRRLNAEKLATNAQLDAARKAVGDAEAALAAQAQLGGAHAEAVLTAPADGVVTAVAVQRGERVAAGTTLVQLAPEAALAAQLGVEPGAAATIRPGMPVAITPVYASKGTPPLPGTVAMAGNAVNPQTHLVDVVATLAAAPTLAQGTALSADITTGRFEAWAVPRAALQTDAQGSYVFQVEHGKAHRVDVEVRSPDGSPVGVEGALDPDAPVITLGSYEVTDGDAVAAHAANAAGP